MGNIAIAMGRWIHEVVMGAIEFVGVILNGRGA